MSCLETNLETGYHDWNTDEIALTEHVYVRYCNVLFVTRYFFYCGYQS